MIRGLISYEARKRTIEWLNDMQSAGEFEGFDEDKMNFEKLPDDEVQYYFLEWYCTQDKIDNDEFESDTEILNERARLLRL